MLHYMFSEYNFNLEKVMRMKLRKFIVYMMALVEYNKKFDVEDN